MVMAGARAAGRQSEERSTSRMPNDIDTLPRPRNPGTIGVGKAMGELPKVTPEYFQILVIRELRKAGFDVGDVRIHRRSELPEPQRASVLELAAPPAHAGWHK